MHLSDAFRNALQSISNHKMRSFLTLTGIVIGVLAVVTMFSSIYALKTMVTKNMKDMGWNNSLIIIPNYSSETESPKRGIIYPKTPRTFKPLNYSDFKAIKDNIKAKSIYGWVDLTTNTRFNNKNVQIKLIGTNTDFFTSKTYILQSGRYFNRYEEENALPVIILGYYFAQEQYGNSNPLGKKITLGQHQYTVIGILDKDKLNSGNGMNFNNWQRINELKNVYIPLKYGTTYISDNNSIHTINIQAENEQKFAEMKTQVRQLLLAKNNMYPNFSFMDIGAMMLNITKEIEDNMRKWNITLFAIASISLIVGGIGLFSTLLISIQEKMLEIGVRKSIGATEKDIFFYFIFEAITLAILGALLGILLAGLALMGMQTAFKIPMPLPWQGMILGMLFSIIIGFVSGLYPALKASKLDPIKAIYYFD